MKAKRLPCINEQLDSQILLLEEMVKDKTFNNIDKINELNNNIFNHLDINLKSKKIMKKNWK